MIRYCRTDRDVRHVLIRIAHRRIERPILIFICDACNLMQASSVPVVMMDGKAFCEADALKRAREKEPNLTEADFKSRLQPYSGVLQLRRYCPAP